MPCPRGQSATVTKTMKQGKVNLSFGLPRGEAVKGVIILGYYASLEALRGAVTAPEAGDA